MPAETDFDHAYLLAGEYVCGLVSAEERKETEGRIDRDATFRAMVQAWEAQLASLNATYESLNPPDVWSALDKALFAPKRRRLWLRRAVVAGAVLVVAGKAILLLHLF